MPPVIEDEQCAPLDASQQVAVMALVHLFYEEHIRTLSHTYVNWGDVTPRFPQMGLSRSPDEERTIEFLLASNIPCTVQIIVVNFADAHRPGKHSWKPLQATIFNEGQAPLMLEWYPSRRNESPHWKKPRVPTSV